MPSENTDGAGRLPVNLFVLGDVTPPSLVAVVSKPPIDFLPFPFRAFFVAVFWDNDAGRKNKHGDLESSGKRKHYSVFSRCFVYV